MSTNWNRKIRQNTQNCKIFFRDAASAAKDFPQYCFIEPAYNQPGAADDHPPHDVFEGEHLLASVYNAIRRNDNLWKTCLFVVLFDEHGGFYDHVIPPATVPPDHYNEEYNFNQLGLRVPAILVSPFVKAGVDHTVFDHTSLLKYLVDKWGLGPLGDRVAQANTFSSSLLSAPSIQDGLPEISSSILVQSARLQKYGQIAGRAQPALSAHQSALVGMTQLLESMTDVGAEDLRGRTKRLVTGFDGVVDVAMERTEQFLGQQKQIAKS